MGLLDVIQKRAKEMAEGGILTRDVPGAGLIRIKRLNSAQFEALPEKNFRAALIQACVMRDVVTVEGVTTYHGVSKGAPIAHGEDGLFFGAMEDVDADVGVRTALIQACQAINGLDVEGAGKK